MSRIQMRGYKIGKFDKEGNLISKYDTTVEAGNSVGLSNTSICAVLYKKRKTAGGYVWKWLLE